MKIFSGKDESLKLKEVAGECRKFKVYFGLKIKY
jgi:hypothetical protein